MRLAHLTALAALVLVSGCSEDATSSEDCTPGATLVCMRTNSFDPGTLTTARGTNVEWRNGDNAAHTTTSSPGNPAACPSWDQTLDGGSSSVARVLFTVSAPVTCQYYCKLHATPTSGQMRGSIVLQ